jgi:hypothetical protein
VTGFLRGIFGSKNKDTSAEPAKPKSQPAPRPQNTGAFFLDSDSAKTYGNLDYMRQAKKIRRTFPKTADSPEEKELTIEVSSMNMRKEGFGTGPIQQATSFESAGFTPTMPTDKPAPKVDQGAERRRSDSSMEMFRNMARDIRKK